MPELPEVETVRRQLAPRIVGRRVVGAGAHPSAKFATAVDATGRRITSLDRRGKYLIAALDPDAELVVHLGMTGALAVHPGPEPPRSPYLRAWWRLSPGPAGDPDVLAFTDVRRFGRTVVLASGEHHLLPTLGRLGPEPLGDDFTVAHLRSALRAAGAPLKAVLLGQRVVAGVGNIYCDEACWRAGVHPGSRRVPAARVPALHAAIRDVLREGIDHGGTTFRDYRDGDGGSGSHQHHLDCYGRHGQPCRRCGTTLVRSVVTARGTTWCPACQPPRGLRPRRAARATSPSGR